MVPLPREGVRHEHVALAVLSGGSDLEGMDGHSQLIVSGGYPSDRVLRWQDNNRVYVTDSGSNY